MSADRDDKLDETQTASDPARREAEAIARARAEADAATPGSSDRPRNAPHIDGYEFVRELHRGGQGVVYQALEKATKRKVAIKVLLEGPYASDHARRRFEREIELAASLKHPNVVAVYHSGLTPDGRQFCVMDYVRGVPLHHYVREQKLGLEDALKLFARVCEAVNYAHQKGIIHRDLKPSNILVDSDGSPKVLDFGLAKQVGGPEQTLVSLTGQVVGTLPYLSPEQARGNPDEIDIRTDVYSLGVVLYEMLTGQFPYPVIGQMADVLRHIAATEPTPPSRNWKADSGVSQRTTGRKLKLGACPIDDEVQTIVLRALTKERQRRYQSAADLGDDVNHYLKNEPIEAKKDSALYVLGKQLRRYRGPAVVAGVFVLLLAGFAGAMTYMAKRNGDLAKHNGDLAKSEVAARHRADAKTAEAEQATNEAKLSGAFSKAQAAWAMTLAAMDGNESEMNQKDVQHYAPGAFDAARNTAEEAEGEAAAGRNERATVLYKEAAADLTTAQKDAVANKLQEQFDAGIAKLERAVADKMKFDAEGAVEELVELVPNDPRLAGWRARAEALPWPDPGDLKIETVPIRAGTFTMGTSGAAPDEDWDYGKPAHEVTISQPFEMGKYEITQEQWRQVMGGNPSRFKGAKRPVNNVFWNDCQKFVNRLNKMFPGKTYSLPTEAQWEYACRAGSQTVYCFGDDAAQLGDYAWYDGNSEHTTHDVGGKQPNAWGLYDMHGNVWEWCEDRYGAYSADAQKDPTGPAEGTGRVLRGGSWYCDPTNCRSAFRSWITPGDRGFNVGLRVVVVVSSGTP